MPAALDVEWGEVKMLAMQIGPRAAARRMGLNENAVLQRSSREKWMVNIPRDQPLPLTMKQPVTGVISAAQALRDEMADMGSKSRLNMARALYAVSEHVVTREPEINLADASNVKQTIQSQDILHGWKESNPVAKVALTITGGQIAQTIQELPPVEGEWEDAGEPESDPQAGENPADPFDLMSF